MAIWVVRALVQGGVSLLPGRESWNYAFQKHITKSLDLGPAAFTYKLAEARRHLDSYHRLQDHGRRECTVLELGTGWYPIIPLLFHLCGVGRILTVDKSPWLRVGNVRKALHAIVEHARDGQLSRTLPWIVESRLTHVESLLLANRATSLEDLLAQFNIEYAVLDARRTGLPDASVDFLFSNGVLQAIPGPVLVDILAECRRICATHARMSHHVIIGDQYAGRDRTITPLNFLKFSESVWRLFNNSLHYQNRLRLADYRRLLEAAGLTVVLEDSDRSSPTELDNIRVAKQFRGYSRDELLITRTWLDVELRDAQHLPGSPESV